MNPLLEPVEDQDQLYLLDLLATTFRERGHWPNWQFVEAMLERRGADPVSLVASLPSVGARQGVYGFSYGFTWTKGSFGSLYAPDDPMGLTIAGWYQAGASDVIGLFLAVLRLANRRLDDFVPDPKRVMAVELSSTDVETELGGLLHSTAGSSSRSWGRSPRCAPADAHCPRVASGDGGCPSRCVVTET